MFVLVYLKLLLVASLLRLNVELDDPLWPCAIFISASLFINLLIGGHFFVVLLHTLAKSPFAFGCFWGAKKLESQKFIYWALGILFSSQLLMRILV